MEFKVEKQGPCLSKLSITVPSSDVDAAFDKAVRTIAKKAEMPGFRPGKVPRHLIERNYGQQMLQEAIDGIVRSTLFTAIDKAELAAVSMPTLDFKPPVRGEDFVYTAEVEVQPEIELKQTDGLKVPPHAVDVPEDGVDKAIEDMRTQGAQTVPVQGRNTVQMGDFVLLDYEGKIDGEAFPGGKAANALVEVVAGEYIPGFAEGLEGATVPGQIDVPVTFPEDYGAKHLAGKAAVFTMTLHELKEKELPKLDDEFAKDMGHDSVDALKKSIHDRLHKQASREADNKQRKGLLQALIEANPFEVPPSMIDNQVERIIQDTTERMRRMTGRPMNLGPDELADIRSSSREDAEFQVRSGLLLMAVSKKAEVVISDEAVAQEIDRLAEESPAQAEGIRQAYSDNERKEELRFRLLEQKVIADLLAKSVTAAA